jgi:hypothetical protein
VQQRLFQLIQSGELALVDGFEAAGFGYCTLLQRMFAINEKLRQNV